MQFADIIASSAGYFSDRLKTMNLASAAVWRQSSLLQIFLCFCLGILVSAATIFLHFLMISARAQFFGLPEGIRLSEAKNVDKRLIFIVPILGGLALSFSSRLVRIWRSNEIVDPIEANAVYGGRLSMRDSLRLLLATLISNISGLSLGMEAAYSQGGAAITSWFGQRLKLRREDLRIFVAAGSAAAISSAFNAPLAGAFYGFELILGIYTIRALPHVAAAALSSVLFMRIVSDPHPVFSLPIENLVISPWHYFFFLGMGILAATIGIAMMKSVTYCEKIFKKFSVPEFGRPALGGLIVGLIGVFFPQVMGSGQGAINNHLHNDWPFLLLLAILAAKIIASSISIGFGFRGGLFSAALFIGCIFGQISGKIAGLFLPENSPELSCFMLVGMGAVAASVVGAPVTIILLVLEMTESFSATTPVFAAVLISAIITRYSFGYSFSTWRFHVRGLRITGAFDIGWINEMRVSNLMQPQFKTANVNLTLSELRELIPAGSTKRIFLIDVDGAYQGTLDVADLHNSDSQKTPNELSSDQEHFLLPSQNIKEAIDRFSEWQMEEMPVVASSEHRIIIGTLAESYVLRRYAQGLEAQNSAQSGAGTPAVK